MRTDPNALATCAAPAPTAILRRRRALTYDVAATLDGFIAGPDGQFDSFQGGVAMSTYRRVTALS